MMVVKLKQEKELNTYIITPNLVRNDLTRSIAGVDHLGKEVKLPVIEEKPLTIFLNDQEIVTAMTIGDYPEYLALGFLKNQRMLLESDIVTGVDFELDLNTVVVRTENKTNFENKLKKKTQTSGCAVGTVFGDMMEGMENLVLDPLVIKASNLYTLSKKIKAQKN